MSETIAIKTPALTVQGTTPIKMADIINRDELEYYKNDSIFIFHGELGNFMFPLGAILASNLQDALDEMIDAGKFDRYQVDEDDIGDGNHTYHEDDIVRAGNASEPFFLSGVTMVQVEAQAFLKALNSFAVHVPAVTTGSF